MGVNVGKPDVLIKLDEENGKLTYGGVPVCDVEHSGGSGGESPASAASTAVALVDNFSELDPDAEGGSLALAKNPEYALSPIQMTDYNDDKEEYRLANQLVSFSPEIEYRESVYNRALQAYMNKYPILYYQFWQGATFTTDRKEHGVFRSNGDGTYTEITDSLNVGDDISEYYYSERDRRFYLEMGFCSTRKDFSIWGREEMFVCTVPIVPDAQDNIFVRERIQCDGILGEGIIAPDATTKYLIAGMWSGDPLQRTFLDIFPGASKISGNIYRVPLMVLYAFEDMDASLVVDDDDEYNTETVSFHLQAGWNVLYVTASMRLNAREKEWQMENAEYDSVEPLDGAPHYAIQTDETGTIDFGRDYADQVLDGVFVQKKEVHPVGLYIKTTSWFPISPSMLPKIDVDKNSGILDELYERVDEMTNDLEDNPPYHHNRQVLDSLYDDGGVLTYNGNRMRAVVGIDRDQEYDGFDSYRIDFADGSAEYFNIIRPKGVDVSSMCFNFSQPVSEDTVTVYYTDGTFQQFPLYGFNFNLAFQGGDSGSMLHHGRQFGDHYAYFKFGNWAEYGEWYPLCVDISDLDRNTAKLDYIDMMMGTGFETEGLYDRAQRNYTAGYWNADHLRQAVAHGWIGTDDFKNMTGMTYDEPYDDPGDEPYDDPDDEPYVDPGDEPYDDPDDEPYDDPGDEPDDVPGDEPYDNPGDEPDDVPKDEPYEEETNDDQD